MEGRSKRLGAGSVVVDVVAIVDLADDDGASVARCEDARPRAFDDHRRNLLLTEIATSVLPAAIGERDRDFARLVAREARIDDVAELDDTFHRQIDVARHGYADQGKIVVELHAERNRSSVDQ